MTDTAATPDAEVEPEVVPGVPVTIDGREIIADEGELIIDAAERHGIYIPRFCYHPRMTPVGMCRMCICEVDTGRGPALQPTCMLECTPGMVVETASPVTTKAQEGVLELLLINHPLDCPVCDKGGECPLQDQTVANGPGESRFVEEKRHKAKPIPISDIVLLDRERCILCDRCTRFAKEVAGDPLIHFINRGNDTEVNTFPDDPFASYFSGNTVQICPVGALTSATYRFRARPWDLEAVESTCQTCAVGCRMAIESSRNEVLRYQGVDIDPVNWGWLCDKGRFNFEALGSEHRLREPLIKQGDAHRQARWAEALGEAAAALQAALDAGGPERIGVIGGARLTNEAAYAWAKLAKGVLGTDNVDCRLGDSLPAEAVLGLPQATIDDACRPGGTVLYLGPDPKEALPVLYLRLRHALVHDGIGLVEVTPVRTSLSDHAAVVLQHRPGEVHTAVRALLHGIPQGQDAGGVDPDALDAARARVAAAAEAGTLTVVVGTQSVAESPQWVTDAAAALAEAYPQVRFLPLVRRGNERGALEMGLAPGLLPGRTTLADGAAWYRTTWPTVPGAAGLDTAGILTAAAAGQIDTLVLLGADPLTDFPDRDLATRGLDGARRIIALDIFLNPSVLQADVVLPVAAFGEVEGSTTNLEGRISLLNQKVTPPGTARSDWEIAAELARRLGSDLQVASTDDLWNEAVAMAPSLDGITLELLLSPDASDGVVAPLPAEATPVPDEPADDAADAPVAATEPDEPADADADSDEDAEADGDSEPTGPSTPPMVAFSAAQPLDPPALDAYALRLVATRKLYDLGTLTQASPSLAGLTPGTVLRVNPYDFDRLGVVEGQTLRVKSPRGGVEVEIVTDATVLRGTAAVHTNQPDVAVNRLIDATQPVTDIRIETGGAA